MSNVRSPPLMSSSKVAKQYKRGRAAGGLTMFILLWSALWLLNGYFTARTVVAGGMHFSLGLGWGAGWLTHIVLALIELSIIFITPYLRDAPLFIVILLWIVALPFGIFDVGSSTIGLSQFFTASLHIPPSLILTSICTVLAEGIAIAPEPVIIWLIIALVRVTRDR